MKWNFYEMRMLRLAINHARLDNEMPARKGSDGDLMVKEWLADRGDARLRPTEEYVCIAVRHIRDHRDSMPQYTPVEIKRWDALLEKLCDEPVRPLIERIHETDLVIDAELELDDGTYLVAVHDDDPSLDYDQASREAIEAGDAFGIIHFDHDAEQIDSLWGMIGYGGGFKAIYGYIEQQGWKLNPQTNKYMTDRAPTAPPAQPQKFLQRPLPAWPGPVSGHETKPTQAALSSKEEGVIDSMLRLGWYTERKAAVAHIMRMRESGRVTGLEDISMVEAARYHPSLMSLPSWGSR